MTQKQTRQSGFTIVELLIVIVVIGILAAITIVAYNGIQDRANNTAVQSDLRSIAMKVMEYQAINGEYPTASGTNGITGVTDISVTAGSYSASGYNLYYCTGVITGSPQFAIMARSASNTIFMHHSASGASEYTGSWDNGAVNCPGAGFINGYAYTYGRGGATWYAWTGAS